MPQRERVPTAKKCMIKDFKEKWPFNGNFLLQLCLAYHKGKLPANLHYNEPQDQIPAVRDGRIQVVTENADFDRGYTALNNFSYTGANFHVVLKGHYRKKVCLY